jgi:cyclase
MLKTRVIPCLLMRNQGLVKTIKFRDPKYVGDPINAVKIFNDKEVDELLLLDIAATVTGKAPKYEIIKDIAGECFMPLSYGGGIRSIDDIRKIFLVGVEKVVVNSYALERPQFVREASDIFGSQSIVVSMDVRKGLLGKYEVFRANGSKSTKLDPVQHAKRMANLGAGEIFVNSIDRDGTQKGYDLELIRRISTAVAVPVVACGGAGCLKDFKDAVLQSGASAVAAGSFFVFHGKHRAVLISYPEYAVLEELFK